MGEDAVSMHFHLAATLVRSTRLRGLQRKVMHYFPGAECDVGKMQGSAEQAKAYVCKQDTTAVEGWEPEEVGVMPTNTRSYLGTEKQLTASHATAIRDLVEEGGMARVVEEAPAAMLRYSAGIKAMEATMSRSVDREYMHTTVYWGDAGAGKSTMVREDVEELDGGVFYMKCVGGTPGAVWFDGYNGEETLVIEDVTGATFSHQQMLAILGFEEFRVQTKGGSIPGSWTRVLMTSNVSPWQWYHNFHSKMENYALRDAFHRRLCKIVKVTKGDEEQTEVTVHAKLKIQRNRPAFHKNAEFRVTRHMVECDEEQEEQDARDAAEALANMRIQPDAQRRPVGGGNW